MAAAPRVPVTSATCPGRAPLRRTIMSACPSRATSTTMASLVLDRLPPTICTPVSEARSSKPS